MVYFRYIKEILWLSLKLTNVRKIESTILSLKQLWSTLIYFKMVSSIQSISLKKFMFLYRMNAPEALKIWLDNFSVVFQDFYSRYNSFKESVKLNNNYFFSILFSPVLPFSLCSEASYQGTDSLEFMTFIYTKTVCFDYLIFCLKCLKNIIIVLKFSVCKHNTTS